MDDPDLWRFERRAHQRGHCATAGVDEVGRGPLAGPVVAAAVRLPLDFSCAGITDSKKLTSAKRSRLYEKIYKGAVSIGIGIVDSAEIDRINILRASLKAMAMAADGLSPQPDFLLIDGPHALPSSLPQEAIPHGDALSISIAAASIVAKVTRDRMMERYDLHYPEYGFARHKGYPTRDHREAIRRFGCCPIHRRSFRGVKEHA
jgi:ribonuclease HII